MNFEALAPTIFLKMSLLVLSMNMIYTNAWLIADKGTSPGSCPIRSTETGTSSLRLVLPIPIRSFYNSDKCRNGQKFVRLHESASDAAGTEEISASSCNAKISDLNDMDIVVYSLLDDDSNQLCLGALQEDGVLSPLSAWTDEPAFGDSIEFLVDEVDRFTLQQQTNDQREADGIDADGNDDNKNTIRIHHVLSDDELSYGQRQCARGVHNPHGEESELLYYIDQQIIDRFEIGVELKPELETLW